MGTQQPIRKAVTPEIPDKLYFRIGDVARLCEVPTYVLRFWETEFPQLKPNKGGTGQRLYRRRDVELALRIKSLLYDQGYTIPGARQVFKNELTARSAEAAAPAETAVTVAAVPSSSASAAPMPVQDSGALLRHQARLRGLREEMAALLASLREAPGPGARGAAVPKEMTPVSKPESRMPEGRMPESKVNTMRPRLVLEPRPTGAKRDASEGAGGATGLKLQLAQRDLFAGEAATNDEWPEPPAAS